MGTLAAGFLTAWVAVVMYVGWLSWQQQVLHKRLDAAERRGAATVDASTQSRAA